MYFFIKIIIIFLKKVGKKFGRMKKMLYLCNEEINEVLTIKQQRL